MGKQESPAIIEQGNQRFAAKLLKDSAFIKSVWSLYYRAYQSNEKG
jgi:hypothetical protein